MNVYTVPVTLKPGRPHVITSELTGCSAIQYVFEASELGLPVGSVPRFIKWMGYEFLLIKMNADTFECVYWSPVRRTELIVLND